jgi:limonene-1,2-epoxide hydrolase
MPSGIESVDQLVELWTNTYNAKGKPDWSHILPYYADNICFRDSIQEIHGIDEFRRMTERLAKRSQELRMKIVRAGKQDNEIFLEWEMTLVFRKRPESVLYGMSRVTLNDDGRIAEQRDYYDLWGDIFDNIPFMAKRYRRFMRKKFG